jgi:hypothetical protein
MEFVECFDKIIVWFNNHVKMMTFFLSTKLFDNSRLFTTRKLKKKTLKLQMRTISWLFIDENHDIKLPVIISNINNDRIKKINQHL